LKDTEPRDGPEGSDRRRQLRRRPSYSNEDLEHLVILQVQLWGDVLYCLLSDHAMLCVPLNITPVVSGAPVSTRYQWQLGEDRRSILWTGGKIEERLRLPVMLAHPGSALMLPTDH
jgi:hypothetical protein